MRTERTKRMGITECNFNGTVVIHIYGVDPDGIRIYHVPVGPAQKVKKAEDVENKNLLRVEVLGLPSDTDAETVAAVAADAIGRLSRAMYWKSKEKNS